MYRVVGRNVVSSSLVLSLVINLCIDKSVTGTHCGNGSSMICTLVKIRFKELNINWKSVSKHYKLHQVIANLIYK